MSRSDWTIRETAKGFSVFYQGKPWPMEPKPSQRWCEEYILRLMGRYQGGSAEMMVRDRTAGKSKHARGGPWRYTYPSDGGPVTGVIKTSRKDDAKTRLRAKLGRKRLPNGIEWEMA